MQRERGDVRLHIGSVIFSITLVVALLNSAQPAYAAGQIFEMNTSVRALGMGNAYMGVVKDADSLFYNPAGLNRVQGFNWLIVDPRAGASGYEVFEDVKKIQDDEKFEEAVRDLYGDHVWAGVGLKSAITVPHFGAAVYNHLDASVDVNNPVYPNLDVSVMNDFGYVAGVGFPLAPFLHFGIVAKRIKRIGSRQPFGPSFVATLDPDSIKDNIKKEGTGYGFDLGGNIVVPLPMVDIVASAVWKDVGQTKFKAENGSETPPPQEQEMALGLAVNVDAPLISITPAIDIKHLNREDIQLAKKVHLGVEIGLPLIDIRAGLYQGYHTYGAGVNLGVIRADVASYGVELGEYPGQREDRRYALQLTIELGFNPNLSFMGGGSGGGGSRSPNKRLKQRR